MVQREQLRSDKEALDVMHPEEDLQDMHRVRPFVRAVEGVWNLNEWRRDRLAEVPRVFTVKLESGKEGNHNIFRPGDEPFRTQSLDVHYVVIAPGSRNLGHGHENEAMFYILQGSGWEEHDGQEYTWGKGDTVAVHNDSVHVHCNTSQTDWAVAIVYKAKSMFMFLGMVQQGHIGYVPPDEDQYGPRVEWSIARRPENVALKKVLKPEDTPWEWTPHGYMRKISGTGVPLRIKATTAHLLEIPAASRTGRRWQMADQCIQFLEGSGYSLHWDVAAEIGDKYYAHIKKEPSRWEWKAGDSMWIPQNTVFQHFNTDPNQPAKFIIAQNTAFEWLGYQAVDLEPCPEQEKPGVVHAS
jgi:quercetin dioxygenase-like cupin family protein